MGDAYGAGGAARVVCQMDNILVFGDNKSEHDKWLCVTLEKLGRAGVTLNAKKYEFN